VPILLTNFFLRHQQCTLVVSFGQPAKGRECDRRQQNNKMAENKHEERDKESEKQLLIWIDHFKVTNHVWEYFWGSKVVVKMTNVEVFDLQLLSTY
jgi:hypothetical protein